MAKTRVAISTSSFAEEDRTPLQALEKAGVEVVPNPYGRRLTEEEIIELLKNIDGLLAGVESLNRKVLSSSSSLKAVARVGIGISNVDLAAAKELGIKVSNTPEGPTQAVAELTVTAMLSLTRRIFEASALMHKGQWKKIISKGLDGLNVLFLGYGRIGRRVRDLLRGFRIVPLVVDPYVDKNSLSEGDTLLSLDEALPQADIITMHASGSGTLLGERELASVKPGVIILNAARGGLIDEKALIASLQSGRVAGAWMDVFDKEPYEGPLRGYENVLLTPHIATYTRQCRLDMEMTAVQNLLHDLGTTGGSNS